MEKKENISLNFMKVEYNFQHSTLAFVPETPALNNILLNSWLNLYFLSIVPFPENEYPELMATKEDEHPKISW